MVCSMKVASCVNSSARSPTTTLASPTAVVRRSRRSTVGQDKSRPGPRSDPGLLRGAGGVFPYANQVVSTVSHGEIEAYAGRVSRGRPHENHEARWGSGEGI